MPPAKPEQLPAFKFGVSLAIGVLVLALGGGAFAVWKFYFQPAPAVAVPKKPADAAPAKPVATALPQASNPPAPTTPAADIPPTKPATANSPSSKLREALTAPQRDEQARVDALATGEAPPEKSEPDATMPAAPLPPEEPELVAAPTVVVSTPLAPGVTANITAPPVSIRDAGPEFRAFVANAKITGVFQGERGRGRAFINGRITTTGDTIDASLGIVFDSIDAQRKQIVFKDRTGAIATRKY